MVPQVFFWMMPYITFSSAQFLTCQGFSFLEQLLAICTKGYTDQKWPRNEVGKKEFSMNCLLIVYSYHHNNTQKVAKVMAKVLDAPIKTPQQTSPSELLQYDLVGFGSGIYAYQHAVSLLELADKLPQIQNKKAFIFSTTGTPVVFGESALARACEQHKPLREKLQSKGYFIVDEFICGGYNTNRFLKYFGGINKGRPNAEDLKNAEEFAQKIKQQLQRNEEENLVE
jgi:flavodoxin